MGATLIDSVRHPDPPVLETPLHDLHLELGARMVPFAGYRMPLNYADGIISEHCQVRAAAGLFDVSHMGQVTVQGPSAASFLESLMPADIEGLATGRQRYSFFTNETGGILDDLMVQRVKDCYTLVVNAANKAADLILLQRSCPADCTLTLLNDQALLALQGPAAATVLGQLAPAATTMSFMEVQVLGIAGFQCTVSRSGYTGEDGFEISVAATEAEGLARELLAAAQVTPIGLGARDSLRLEAGLCLHGQDITLDTSPIEANLQWAIPGCRRLGGTRAGGFPGAQRILTEATQGVARVRVGIKPDGKAPIRAGAVLQTHSGAPVGEITSGSFGPSIKGPIAMGYVDAAHTAVGTALHALVRGKLLPTRVANLPFSPHNYYRNRKPRSQLA